ncbi:hypothetical protein ABPG77_001034 [Micractinium sp. CCAP 211/92]
MLGRIAQLAGRRAALQRGMLARAAVSGWHSQTLWTAQSPQPQGSQQPAAAAVLLHHRARCLSTGSRQQRQQQRPAAKPKAAEEAEGSEEDAVEQGGAVALGDLSVADDDFVDDWEELEEQVGPELSTGGVEWGEKALAVVQQLLESPAAADAGLQDIRLFSFRAIPSSKRLDIRLDKLTDQYGSPSLDDVATFSRQFNEAYEAAVGETAAGEIEVEVSSPGAERQVRVPVELERFAELPMRVEYCLEGDKVDVKVLGFESHDAAAALTRWRLADVRVNRTGGKGRGLSRKQRDAVFELPLSAIRRVNLHIDF